MAIVIRESMINHIIRDGTTLVLLSAILHTGTAVIKKNDF